MSANCHSDLTEYAVGEAPLQHLDGCLLEAKYKATDKGGLDSNIATLVFNVSGTNTAPNLEDVVFDSVEENSGECVVKSHFWFLAKLIYNIRCFARFLLA